MNKFDELCDEVIEEGATLIGYDRVVANFKKLIGKLEDQSLNDTDFEQAMLTLNELKKYSKEAIKYIKKLEKYDRSIGAK